MRDLFKREKPIIGMVHLQPFPGCPGYGGSIDKVIARAVEDAKTLEELLPYGDGFIVGTYFKEHRDMMEPVMASKVKEFMRCYDGLTGGGV